MQSNPLADVLGLTFWQSTNGNLGALVGRARELVEDLIVRAGGAPSEPTWKIAGRLVRYVETHPVDYELILALTQIASRAA
ncbi:MAG TPA: hypothetical protein VLC93_00680 [Myxococcota bacterium]|nr:hypothetical protein [Myxococcota bacterium]